MRRRAVTTGAWILLVLLLCGGLRSAAYAADLSIGQPAPDFTLPDETGKLHRLWDYRGHTVVLMFYPKDFTSG